jgi:hypothetical protein
MEKKLNLLTKLEFHLDQQMNDGFQRISIRFLKFLD